MVRHHLHGIAHRGQVVHRIPLVQQREVVEQLFVLLLIQVELQILDTAGQYRGQRLSVEREKLH